jgi:hypothetical protein
MDAYILLSGKTHQVFGKMLISFINFLNRITANLLGLLILVLDLSFFNNILWIYKDKIAILKQRKIYQSKIA